MASTEWYAVILVTTTENPSEPPENRYLTHTKTLAIHRDEMIAKEYACQLSEDYGFPYWAASIKDLIDDPHNYAGGMVLATDMFNLDPTVVENYAKQHRILGKPDFKLKIPKSMP